LRSGGQHGGDVIGDAVEVGKGHDVVVDDDDAGAVLERCQFHRFSFVV
jgi:hypothetical protein